jgi:hypothetical protein
MSMQLTIWAGGLYEHISSTLVREDNPSMSFYKSLVKAGNQDFVPSEYTLFTKSIESVKT